MLNSYNKIQPSVSYTIKNFHYEMKEIKTTRIIKADSEIRSLRSDYREKLMKTR